MAAPRARRTGDAAKPNRNRDPVNDNDEKMRNITKYISTAEIYT